MEQSFVERINLVYKSTDSSRSEETELPFRLLVLGNFSGASDEREIDEQCYHEIRNGHIDTLMAGVRPRLRLSLPNRLLDGAKDTLAVELEFETLRDFEPDNVLRKIPLTRQLLELREHLLALADGKTLAESLHGDFLQALGLAQASRDALAGNLDFHIAEIDLRLSRQWDALLAEAAWRELESAWRGLSFLAQRTRYEENCRLSVLDVSKENLASDFDDCADVTQSALYQRVYTAEFGQFGGQPYGALIADYAFGPGARDIRLLQQLASVSAMAHAPFIAAAAPAFFGIETYAELARLRDLRSHFQQPRFAKWNGLRESEDARYIALTLPRFLLRKPYDTGDERIMGFDYQASPGQEPLWGNTAFAFATRLNDSFAKYRWCASITGKEDGAVSGLAFGGQTPAGKNTIPTEVLIADRRSAELVEFGFLPLTLHKRDETVAFYSSRSIQKLKQFGDSPPGKEAALNHRLGAELAYLMIVNRFSHYIKVMQREHIGSWKNRIEVERELNDWLRQFVSDMDNPTAAVRARRPLRRAKLRIEELEGKGDWYFINLSITPHLKYMGSPFSLTDRGKLEKT